MEIPRILSILNYLKDFAEDKNVELDGVNEAIAMFEECDTYEECKKWIHDNV